ncbi:UNVERIFIED_CONTAM: hypothetical protein PYX00_008409 [Menopon gallinae]|uniref:CCDC66 domain-containing protein n=1 Tax=Menopon gallinae TaxID=328185 RepID=A0AAW2HMR6_9NEOP
MSSMKTLSLLEQKRLQWAKEKEEMVGLCGLWGHPKYRTSKSDTQKSEELQLRKNVLPPIPTRSESEEKGPNPEESETSGYLSDSPKHLTEKEGMDENRYSNETANPVWYIKQGKRDTYSTDENTEGSNPSYAMDRKSYKNYRNEKWAQQQSADPWHSRNAKNWWFGTPESVSSDDGSRLRWGDRGVGIGHLWEPVVHQPDSRLPQLESYRPTPKWVERGLRKADGSQKADILIIHHPDDEQYKNYSSDSQKNFILGQNVRLTPEVIEERERKRRRALEHQDAIRQQLEDRERRRKEERLNKLREERLEEERIKREQETERLRMEEEQRRNKEKEEKEKRKEQVMKEAIEMAERKAREEKLHHRKHVRVEEQEEVVQVKREKPLESSREKKNSVRTPRAKFQEEPEVKSKSSRSEKTSRQTESSGRVKTQKDSSSQFEQLRVPNGVQLLNMNNLPMDGSLALVLDTPPADSNFLLPSDGVQLALLMSPHNVSSLPFQTPIPTAMTPRGRVLTPSKFRVVDDQLLSQRSKTTQTDGMCCPASQKLSSRTVPRCRKQTRRSGRASGGSDSSDKSNSLERPPAHYHCTNSSKHRSRSQPKYSIDDRPKWGINRPSVQYKTQSEKDLYYQKRIRQRLKKMSDMSTSTEPSPKGKDDVPEGKLLHSEMRLLKCDSEEDEVDPKKENIILRNGYRMNSNPSSPLFVPIDTDRSIAEKKEEGQDFVIELTIEPEMLENKNEGKNDDIDEFEDTAVPGSIGYVTQAQLEAIRQIASLREGLQKLQMDFSSSRSITPYSEKNE